MSKSITIVGAFITPDYYEATIAAIEQTVAAMPFATNPKRLLISADCPWGWPERHWLRVPDQWLALPHSLAYSSFMVCALGEFIDTDYALTVQWDGFGLNRSNWSSEFLEYDYVGGPWDGPSRRVGNGGLSLRSRKWLDTGVTAPPVPWAITEDIHMCRLHLDHWLSAGCRPATVETALRFSYSRPLSDFPGWALDMSWGFHGYNCPDRMRLWSELELAPRMLAI